MRGCRICIAFKRMSTIMNAIAQSISRGIEHSKGVADTFLRAACLLETHYQRRPSSLLELFPDLQGQTVTEAEVRQLQEAVVRFIEELPTHSEVTGAVKLLALSGDRNLKQFFVAQLRLHLAFRNASVVHQLLLGLEDLGERVFYDADGQFIGSRSTHDTDINFPVAKRYLQKHDGEISTMH